MSLVGCGINASVEPMTYDYRQSHKAEKKPINKNLINAITVAEVKGGHEVNPLVASEISNSNYKAALEKSLQNAKLFQQEAPAKYSLEATILRFERPLIGLNFTSTLIVDYKLSNTKNHKTVFHKIIKTPYTAKMSDSLIGITRLKMANEGAARENIKKLINDLYKI